MFRGQAIDNKPSNKRAVARAQAIHNAKIKNVKATSKSNAATKGLDFNKPTQYAHMMQNLNKRQKEDGEPTAPARVVTETWCLQR